MDRKSTSARLRFRAFWKDHGWKILAGLAAAVMALATTGYYLSDEAGATPSNPVARLGNALYLGLLQVMLATDAVYPESHWTLPLARVLAVIFVIGAVYGAGIEFFAVWWQNRRIRKWRDHTILCGLDRTGWQLAQAYADRGRRLAVVESDRAHPNVGEARRLGIPVVIGDARSPEILRRAGLRHARTLIAAASDSIGLQIAETGIRECGTTAGPRGLRQIHVRIDEPRLQQQLTALERSASHLGTGASEGPQRHYFNTSDAGAFEMMMQHPPFLVEHGRLPHVLIVGIGYMGQSLLTSLAQRWLWRHRGSIADDRRLPVTIIDIEARERVEALREELREGDGTNLLDLATRLTVREMDVCGRQFQAGAYLALADPRHRITIVYVCVGADDLAVSAALGIESVVRRYNAASGETPVRVHTVVRVAETRTGHPGILSRLMTGRDVQLFGVLDTLCDPDLVEHGLIERLAHCFHGYYLEKRLSDSDMPSHDAMTRWHDLDAQFKDSNREAAVGIVERLAAEGYHVQPLVSWRDGLYDFPDDTAALERLAESEHNRWMAERMADGWTYGPVRDSDARKNPMLRPWTELRPEEQRFNLESVKAWPEMLAHIGFRIERSGSAPARSGNLDEQTFHGKAGAAPHGV